MPGALEHVRVHVEGDRRPCVAELPLHADGIKSRLHDQRARERVPERVGSAPVNRSTAPDARHELKRARSGSHAARVARRRARSTHAPRSLPLS